MAWTVLEAKTNRGDIEQTISDFVTSAGITDDAIDTIDVEKIMNKRVAITVTYTTA